MKNKEEQWKQAAQTLIEQTEDQKQAELARQKAILDAQKASEMQNQKVQMMNLKYLKNVVSNSPVNKVELEDNLETQLCRSVLEFNTDAVLSCF